MKLQWSFDIQTLLDDSHVYCGIILVYILAAWFPLYPHMVHICLCVYMYAMHECVSHKRVHESRSVCWMCQSRKCLLNSDLAPPLSNSNRSQCPHHACMIYVDGKCCLKVTLGALKTFYKCHGNVFKMEPLCPQNHAKNPFLSLITSFWGADRKMNELSP